MDAIVHVGTSYGLRTCAPLCRWMRSWSSFSWWQLHSLGTAAPSIHRCEAPRAHWHRWERFLLHPAAVVKLLLCGILNRASWGTRVAVPSISMVDAHTLWTLLLLLLLFLSQGSHSNDSLRPALLDLLNVSAVDCAQGMYVGSTLVLAVKASGRNGFPHLSTDASCIQLHSSSYSHLVTDGKALMSCRPVHYLGREPVSYLEQISTCALHIQSGTQQAQASACVLVCACRIRWRYLQVLPPWLLPSGGEVRRVPQRCLHAHLRLRERDRWVIITGTCNVYPAKASSRC
jgi:hypothetical protein